MARQVVIEVVDVVLNSHDPSRIDPPPALRTVATGDKRQAIIGLADQHKSLALAKIQRSSIQRGLGGRPKLGLPFASTWLCYYVFKTM